MIEQLVLKSEIVTNPFMKIESFTFPDGMQGGAALSLDETCRYVLTRVWGEGPIAAIVMLNPSTARASVNDSTIRKVIGFGKRWGWGGFVVVNLFAYRTKDPAELKAKRYPIGEYNDHAIQAVMEGTKGPVIYAWGSNAAKLVRPSAVNAIVRACGRTPMAFKLNAGGVPSHPLYLPYDETVLVEMP